VKNKYFGTFFVELLGIKTSIMKRILLVLLLSATFISCEDDSENLPAPYYSIEGKWTFENNNLNTMYLYEDGVRYTFYCTEGDCESLYNTYEAGDGNHIPGTNPYTFENDTLTVDLHFGNELVAPLTFECDGGKVYLDGPNPYYLYRLNSDCN
jgi:hypothetical protein